MRGETKPEKEEVQTVDSDIEFMEEDIKKPTTDGKHAPEIEDLMQQMQAGQLLLARQVQEMQQQMRYSAQFANKDYTPYAHGADATTSHPGADRQTESNGTLCSSESDSSATWRTIHQEWGDAQSGRKGRRHPQRPRRAWSRLDHTSYERKANLTDVSPLWGCG